MVTILATLYVVRSRGATSIDCLLRQRYVAKFDR